MPFFRIDGIEAPVDATSLSQGEPARAGSVDPSFSNQLRSSLRDERRRWRLSTVPLVPDDAEALLAQFRNGRFVVCDGDLFGDGQIRQCYVTATEIPYVHDGAVAHLMALSLAIEETTGVQYAP